MVFSDPSFLDDAQVSVAILSDTHAHLDPRIAQLVADCDIAIHAGDIGAASVLAEMQPRLGQVVAVAGNNDLALPWESDQARTAQGLPTLASVNLPGGCLVVEHGHTHGFQSPCHTSLRRAHVNARLIVYGHSHKLICDTRETPWVVNPGAAGNTRTHGGPSCLQLYANIDHWEILPHRFSDEV
jgi:putative phosphoesterase